MQTFIVKITAGKYTAKEIEEAIYNTFTEMNKEEIIVTESI